MLKVLGQHAEPEHLAYLLSLAPRKKLGSLNLEELVGLLESVDVKLALPLQTLEKLKEARCCAFAFGCKPAAHTRFVFRRRSPSLMRIATAR